MTLKSLLCESSLPWVEGFRARSGLWLMRLLGEAKAMGV